MQFHRKYIKKIYTRGIKLYLNIKLNVNTSGSHNQRHLHLSISGMSDVKTISCEKYWEIK